jgi:hypothetical protein
MKQIFNLLVLGTIVTMICTACTNSPKGKNLIVGIDASGTISKDVLNFYLGTLKTKVLPTLSANDKLVILPIDAGSSNACQEIINIDIAAEMKNIEIEGTTLADEAEKKQRALASMLEAKIFATFDSTMTTSIYSRKQYAGKSDLFGFLAMCPKYLDANRKSNSIIILSDMLQESNSVNISANSTPAELQKHVRKLSIKASVFVLTGETSYNEVSYTNINAFWKSCIGDSLKSFNSANTEELVTALKNM